MSQGHVSGSDLRSQKYNTALKTPAADNGRRVFPAKHNIQRPKSVRDTSSSSLLLDNTNATTQQHLIQHLIQL
jgi:hypothetical protein